MKGFRQDNSVTTAMAAAREQSDNRLESMQRARIFARMRAPIDRAFANLERVAAEMVPHGMPPLDMPAATEAKAQALQDIAELLAPRLGVTVEQLAFDVLVRDQETRRCTRERTKGNTKPSMQRLWFTNCRICVPHDWNRDDIEEWVNTNYPTGIASDWQLAEEHGRIACEKHPGMRHVVVVC
jgi:hypothetical protein